MGINFSKLFKQSEMTALPIVVVLGATGTGKSKLAIELAQKFKGEIISADSMQIYKGLDIITNKVTEQEQKLAVHHFINCVDSLSRYTVVDFRNRALPLINSLIEKNKIPIIVGGTNYYIESLLYDVLIKPQGSSDDGLLYDIERDREETEYKNANKTSFSDSNSRLISNSLIDSNLAEDNGEKETCTITAEELFSKPITKDSLSHLPFLHLHKILSEIDPIMASQLHPHDKRKVIRSLQVYQQHQHRHSEILATQRSQFGGSSLGGPLRYKNCIMFWIQFDFPELEKRLYARVDDMLARGLIDELLNFHKDYHKIKSKQNRVGMYKEGIFQSIGFKEFHNFLILSKEDQLSDEGKRLCDEAIQEIKLATRKYAKKQIKWIRNRFLKKPERDLPPLYGLNATDVEHWNQNIFGVACNVIESLLKNENPEIMPLPIEESIPDVKETHYCDICDKLVVGRRTWEIHMKSRNHYKRKKSLEGKTASVQAS